MIDYQIAIPTYKRKQVIKDKTLSVLAKYKIPTDRVTLFVADEEEKQAYQQSLINHVYGQNIVVGVPTIGAQRNFIERYYPEGTYLMMFDDDIDEVQVRLDEKTLVPVTDLEKEIIEFGFNQCIENKAFTFGIYAASNPYFMQDRVYTKLCYIIASMFGVIVQHDDYLNRITNHGEDYEYSLRQYTKHGKLCRLDNYTVKSNYYKEAGGLQTIRTKEYVRESIQTIANLFPDLCSMYIRQTTGHAELKLRDSSNNKYLKVDSTLDAFF